MELKIRRSILVSDEIRHLAQQKADPPLRKIAIAVVIENPLVDRFEENLEPLVTASVEIGRIMAKELKSALGSNEVESFGKAGLVGLRGEQEHANALLTTAFAEPIRQMIGRAPAWISSVTKIATPGSIIDVPVNSIHDVYVRSHYDSMTLSLSGVPMPDEIALIFCVTTRGRIAARVGGISHEQAVLKGVSGALQT